MGCVLHQLQQGACCCYQLAPLQTIAQRAQLSLEGHGNLVHAALQMGSSLEEMQAAAPGSQHADADLNILQRCLKVRHSSVHVNQLGAQADKVVVVFIDDLKQLRRQRVTPGARLPSMLSVLASRPWS